MTTTSKVFPATLGLDEIRRILAETDDTKADIVMRMRALFDARHHDNEQAIEVLKLGLAHHSVLLRHEIAYVMGQMSQPSALPILIDLLDNTEEHAMVRHEAGEGIAALGLTAQDAFDALERHAHDSDQAVRETCQLALIGLLRTKKKEQALGRAVPRARWDPTKGFHIFTASAKRNEIEKLDVSEFGTCDPADGVKELQAVEKIEELKMLLLDEDKPLWDRYVAMFTLRNIATEKAASALAQALDEKASALLRHEICFVLGQLQLAVALDKLVERLEDVAEHCMVRHEAALALGSVGADVWTDVGRTARKKAILALQKWSKDEEPVVWESCLTGLANIKEETGSLNLESMGFDTCE